MVGGGGRAGRGGDALLLSDSMGITGPSPMGKHGTPRLADVLRRAADDASVSLSKWIGRPTTITVKDVVEVPLEKAAAVLGSGDAPLCVCAMHVHGDLPGILALATDDASGLGLADLLLGRDPGTSTAWGEMERSAASETTNIIGCAYLNAVTHSGGDAGGTPQLMPSPPWFIRDFPESVMGSIVMTQETAADAVFLTHTVFGIEGTKIRCSLVFVPTSAADGGAGRPTEQP